MPQCLVVDVNGVGYEVQVPLSTFDALNPMEGQPVKLKIHMHVRENAQVLYGFATDAERDIFRLLIDRVSGIGPATAISILSGLNVNTFKAAVVNGDVQAIARAKGVGKRTAERIILELKDKLRISVTLDLGGEGKAPGAEQTEAMKNALSVLINLGYSQTEATAAVRAVAEPGMSAEQIIETCMTEIF